MEKTIIAKLDDYLENNKKKFFKNKNVLYVGKSFGCSSGNYYDVAIQVFVQKGTPKSELSDIQDYITIEDYKIPIVIIEGDIEYSDDESILE